MRSTQLLPSIVAVLLTLLTGCPAPSGPDGGLDAGEQPPDAGVFVDAGVVIDAIFVNPVWNTTLAGAIWGGPRGVTLVLSGGNTYPAIAWALGDGGWGLQELTPSGDAIGPAAVAALQPNDYFLSAQMGPVHYLDDVLVGEASTCATSVHWTAVSSSPTGEVWFAGYESPPITGDAGLCRWTKDAGFENVPGPQSPVWSALVTLSDGGLLLGDTAGTVTQLSSGQATQVFPTPVSALFRADQNVWATGLGDGGLASLQPSGTWVAVDTGPQPQDLRSGWASGPDDVWVAGAVGLAHFNGTGWEVLPALPGVPPNLKVTFVSGNQQQLLFGGYTEGSTVGDTHACAVLMHRR